jgi:hypothetical protein
MNPLAEKHWFTWDDNDWLDEQAYRKWLHEIRGRTV